MISPDDSVLHLGDFTFGKKSDFEFLINKVNGKLFLIRGNHDRLSRTCYESHGVTVLNDSIQIEYGSQARLVFSHRPIVPLNDGLINLHGHIHNVSLLVESSNPSSKHINMSVEVREYRPWRLRDIIDLR